MSVIVPTYWRDGVIVSLFEKGDREDTGNYKGITLLNLVGLYSRIIDNHLLKYLELNNELHEGWRRFRIGISCMDNISP